MGFLIGKGGFFIQDLNNHYEVNVKVISEDYKLSQIKRSDSVVIINGPINRVIKATTNILMRINDYYKKNKKNYSDYSEKIIISSAFVSKLIGQKGELVR